MRKKFRKTLLDEYQVLCGVGDNPCAGDFREDVGSFVISHIQENRKLPLHNEIVISCIPEDDMDVLDAMYKTYKKLINNEIDDKEYLNKLNKLENKQ